MVGRIALLGLWLATLAACERESQGSDPNTEKQEKPPKAEGGAALGIEVPPEFDEVMNDHAKLSNYAMNALIAGDLPGAQQSMRKLAFFMEHVPFPKEGKSYARITQELADQVRNSGDLEEASMAFARLSYACGQCHHALNRGPPVKLEPTPQGRDIAMRMKRHYWAVERMWEGLLSDSPRDFQSGARALSNAPLHGAHEPASAQPEGVARLAYEVHDLAFAAAVEGTTAEDEYVPTPGEVRKTKPTSRSQAEIFGQLLSACSQCHTLVGVTPTWVGNPQRVDAR